MSGSHSRYDGPPKNPEAEALDLLEENCPHMLEGQVMNLGFELEIFFPRSLPPCAAAPGSLGFGNKLCHPQTIPGGNLPHMLVQLQEELLRHDLFPTPSFLCEGRQDCDRSRL